MKTTNNTNDMGRSSYVMPSIEIHHIQAEQGFAASPAGGKTEDIIEGGVQEVW